MSDESRSCKSAHEDGFTDIQSRVPPVIRKIQRLPRPYGALEQPVSEIAFDLYDDSYHAAITNVPVDSCHAGILLSSQNDLGHTTVLAVLVFNSIILGISNPKSYMIENNAIP